MLKLKHTQMLDIIAPISHDLDKPEISETIAEIREQHEKYGIHRFALTCPGAGWRTTGLPPESFYRERAEAFRIIQETLAPEGIELAWWNTLTLKSGPDPHWNRMIRMDGSETPMASCPLNPDFKKEFARLTALFAEIAKPVFIITEDDFAINAATFREGCFCEHHLAEFARREGRSYTREELKAILEQTTPEAHELRRRWRALMRDSLAEFAAAMRAAVDTVDPGIPMGTMQAGSWDKDGDATEAVSRAIAGPDHTPFSRLFGCFYGGENILRIPAELFHALYSKQHMGGDFRCYHESDTFPHTRFFTSAACMRTLQYSAFSYGFCGATFQTQQLLDDRNEEKAHGLMLARERKGMQATYDAASQCQLKGVQLLFDRFWSTTEAGNKAAWTDVLARYSIPYTTLDSSVVFLSGMQPAHLSDEELLKILSGNVFLDGEAAEILCKRGYSKYLGVKTGPDPITERDVYDLGGREVIQPGFVPELKGRHMHRADFFAPGGRGQHFSLTPVDPACEVITRLLSSTLEEITVGMTRFVNGLGGKVVVLNQGVNGNQSSSLYNYRRQKLLQELLIWCSDEFVFVKDEARVFLIQNEAISPADAGFSGMLTITNLNPDPIEGIALHLPPQWQDREFLRLNREGEYHPCPAEKTADGARLTITLDYARPEVILAR